MKRIVIKLSERAYEFVQKNGLKDVFGIDTAICNGVVLPQGHGRLIDADALKLTQHDIHVESINYRHRCISVENIDEAPTIIEADEEETTNETTD